MLLRANKISPVSFNLQKKMKLAHLSLVGIAIFACKIGIVEAKPISDGVAALTENQRKMINEKADQILELLEAARSSKKDEVGSWKKLEKEGTVSVANELYGLG